MDLPEEKLMWKERQELENPKEDIEDSFVPAKEFKRSPDDKTLIKVNLNE